MNGYQGKTTTTKQANKKPLKFLKATFFSQLQNLSAETHISLGKGTANSHSFSSSCFLMILYLTLGEPLDWVSLFSLRWKYGNQSKIFFFTLTFISCLWLFSRHVCLRTMCMPGAHRGPRRSQDSLKLELQTAMSHYEGAGNGDAWSSGRIASDFHHWASPALNSLRRGGEIISYYIIFQMLSTYHACHPLTYATKADQGLTVLKNKIPHHFEK